MKKYAIIIFLTLGVISTIQAQKAQIRGVISEYGTGLDLAFVNVELYKDSLKVLSTTSNFEGYYIFKEVIPDTYKLVFSSIGYQRKVLQDILVLDSKVNIFNVQIVQGASLKAVEIITYKKPLIELDKMASETTVSREEINKMAVRSASDIYNTAGNGVYSRDNGTINIRGHRSGSNVTFIDGVKVIGSTNLPNSSIQEVTVSQGGVPARYNEIDVINKEGVKGISLELQEEVVSESRIQTRERKKLKKEPEIYRESYQEIADNPFESPINAPLSTFSIDVDKASYANTRRFLNDGYLPPISAVRIEEMINYFDYDYPQPKDDHPFSITSELSDCPWNSERKLALIGLQGKEIQFEEGIKNNLVFLIDVSGSMSSPDKLGLLKQGLDLLVNELREEDRLAIVVYAGAAGLVLPSTNGLKKEKIREVLDNLSAGGSTAGGAGIELAYKVAEDQFIKNGNNRVILATDGDFNVGVSDTKSLIEIIEKKRETGVFLSVLGFGTGNLQDHRMEQLANKGNGNYNYIDNLLEAKKVLITEMSGTLYTIAKDVKIQAEFNPNKVKAYRLIGYVNRKLKDEDFNNDLKDAGELGAGHSITALYEIIPQDSEESLMDIDPLKYQKNIEIAEEFQDEILTVKFRYKLPNGKESILMTKVLKNNSNSLEFASLNMRFSAAVASFGMKLRGSESVESLNYKEIVSLARQSRGEDIYGYRSEFVKLVETAQLLDR